MFRFLVVLALFVLALAASARAQEPAQRVALVIGNATYAHTTTLRNPHADANLISQRLGEVGFTVVNVALDLDMNAFRERLQQFQREADNAQVALIYYAGHGLEVDGVNWLLPVDADIHDARDLDYGAVRVDLLLQTLRYANLRIVVLDACRDDPFATRNVRGVTQRAPGSGGLAQLDSDGVLIMFAAAPGARADDGGGENSPFAQAFAQHLVQPDLEIHRLPGVVRDRTLELTGDRQRPFISASISGQEFYFVTPTRRSAATAAVLANGDAIDGDTEYRMFQEAVTRAEAGDCGALRAHADALRRGVTIALARSAARNCQPLTATPTDYVPRPGRPELLDRLVAADTSSLTREQFAVVAAELNVEPEALMAVAQVEGGSLGGFGRDGRQIILFEPHIFSRLTQRRFDASNPNVSYVAWDRSRYPRDQAGRWAQLREAFALDAEAALASASWGRFQIIGSAYERAGYLSASAFVEATSRSEVEQLRAFSNLIRSQEALDELQNKDWEGFARLYNGAGQTDRYGRLLREAYDRIKGTA